jgi:hypothetical protein
MERKPTKMTVLPPFGRQTSTSYYISMTFFRFQFISSELCALSDLQLGVIPTYPQNVLLIELAVIPISHKNKTVVIANTHLKAGGRNMEAVRTAQGAIVLEKLHKFLADRHGHLRTPFVVCRSYWRL